MKPIVILAEIICFIAFFVAVFWVFKGGMIVIGANHKIAQDVISAVFAAGATIYALVATYDR